MTVLSRLPKLKILLFVLFITIYNVSFSQLFYNNGADITATSSAIVFVDGVLQNNTGNINADLNSEIIIKSHFLNNATAGGNGFYKVTGDWINNNTFLGASGTVILEGANQQLGGTVSTNFFNLTLSGTGIKTQAINQYVKGTLDLGNLELSTQNFTLFVENTATGAILRTTGFVSSTGSGSLSRETNLSQIYLFPVGSSTGTLRYRPVEITPLSSGAAETYTVRMANVNANTEGFNLNSKETDICELIDKFYHRINKTKGSSNCDIKIYFDESTDGQWDGIANWKNSGNIWNIVTGSSTTTSTPLSYALAQNHTLQVDFPFALYRSAPVINITNPGLICSNDSPLQMVATPAGGTWSSTTANIKSTGLLTPATGTHEIEYTVNFGTCSSSDKITITVTEAPVVSITNALTAFCTTDLPVALTGSPAGGTWTCPTPGAVLGTNFIPSTGQGSYNVTYTATSAGCTASDTKVFTVVTNPDATITTVQRIFCSGDSPVIFSAVTPGGIWSGTGIVNASTGEFNPQGLNGIYTIKYEISTGTCSDFDEVFVQVIETPEITITTSQLVYCTSDPAVYFQATPAGGTWGPSSIITSTGLFTPQNVGQGSFTIEYSVTNNGCTSVERVNVRVYDTPDPTILTRPAAFCTGDNSMTFQAVTTGGIWSGSRAIDPITGFFDPSIAEIGTITIQYSVGTGSCLATDDLQIVITETPNINITAVDNLCIDNGDITLQATPAGGIWTGDGIQDSFLGVFSPTAASTGNHKITYTVLNGSCVSSESIYIVVLDAPVAIIKKPAGPFCYENRKYNLEALTPNGEWSADKANIVSSDGVFDVQRAGEGIHKVYYTVKLGACESVDSVLIEVYPGNIQARYVINNPICYGYKTNVTFTVTGGTPPFVYSWGDEYVHFSDTSYIEGFKTGIYNFRVIDSNGCYIEVIGLSFREGEDPCIEIPNAFTPNGDGVNDTWIIENIESYPAHEVQIFNRWGQLLFEAFDGEYEPWDGTFKGRELPTGSYIYRIKIRDGVDEYSGIVTIVK